MDKPLTLAQLKRLKRQQAKQCSKLQRKVESARKQRSDLYNLTRKESFLNEELRDLLDLSRPFQPND